VSELTPGTESDDLSTDRAPFPELDVLADDSDLPLAATRQRSAIREGLPSHYRMRADAHYVDQLTGRVPATRELLLDARSIDGGPLPEAVASSGLNDLAESIRKHGVLQPLLVRRVDSGYRIIDGARRLRASITAGLRQVPCLLHDVDEDEAAALARAANVRPAASAARTVPESADWAAEAADELGRSLAGLRACTKMLSRGVSSLSRGVASTIVEAEAARASSLLHALRVLQLEPLTARGRLEVRRLIDAALREVDAERSLHGVDIESQVHASEPFAVGDEPQITLAIVSALRATLAVVEGTPAPRIAISTSISPTSRLVIAVRQRTVTVGDGWASRAFDTSWTRRPGGIAACVAMLALRRIVDAHGGETLVEGAGGGTTIALMLPLATT
jgi:ParB/RepB/Spo0J family partition protein